MIHLNRRYTASSILIISIPIIALAVGIFSINPASFTPRTFPILLNDPHKTDIVANQPTISKGWVSEVIEVIKSQEYDINPNNRGILQAPNRNNNLRIYFNNHGIDISRRVAVKQRKLSNQTTNHFQNASSDRIFQWHTIKIGRSANLITVPVAEPQANNNTVVYRKPDLIESYENRPDGIEQTFIITKRHAQTALNDHWVYIYSQPFRDQLLQMSPDKKHISILNKHKVQVLKYGKLIVNDYHGNTLPSFLLVKDNRIVLAFNDKTAHYPVTVDPLLTNPIWASESNQANSSFGYSVAAAGDINGDGYGDVIIGAHAYDNGELQEGRVYVYLGNIAGLASIPIWTGEGNQLNANFGYSVASAGDVNGDGFQDVLIGAYSYTNGEAEEGRVFVYYGNNAGLPSIPSWTSENNQASSGYGSSVSSAGDVNGDGYSDVIIGTLNFGRVYVFYGSNNGLPSTASWIAYGSALDLYGTSVASAGDVNGDGFSDVIIGAPNYDNGESGEGRTFVYLGSIAGLATSSSWFAESNQANALFGTSVASAGDVNGDGFSDVIIGAPNYDNGESDEGRTFVYLGSIAGLAISSSWLAESNQANALFGTSVASAGDVNGDGFSDVIIGAPNYDNGESDEGGAFVYYGSITGLASSSAWSAEGNQASALFGRSVSSAGDINGDGLNDVIIGAYLFDNGEANEGTVNVYLGSTSGPSIAPSWFSDSNQSGAQYGYIVTSLGDINGDGFSDIGISAPYYDTGITDAGRVYIFHGKETGPNTNVDQVLDGTSNNELFGWSVSTAGDINGDGFGDLVVGAPQYSNGEASEGRIYMFSGTASGVNASPALTIESNQAGSQLGFCVACAGDANGDGYSDFLASAPYYNNQGRVSLFAGSAGGLRANPQWFLDGSQAEATFGYSLASAGDVNGDGFSDVIIGAPLYDNGQTDEGQAYLFMGSSAGLNASPVWTAEGDQANARYGHSVSSAGDVNNDGYSDVIVGANLFDGTQSNEGRAYLYHGNPSGLNANFSWSASGGQNSVQFGCAVATAGDVNNDGFGDVIVGACQFPNGRAYFYQGSASGLSSLAAWIGESDQSGAQFGYSAASAGDVNGDGFGDIIVGAPFYDDGQADEGKAFLFFGNSSAALASLPRQMKPGDLNLIGPAGLASNSSDNTDFLVRLVARNSQERTRVKMQVQIAQIGHTISSGSLYTQPNYIDVGLSGSDLSYTISELQPMQAYHWRVRLLYDPSQSGNGQLHSPWYRMPWGSLNGNADFRTGPVAPATPTPTAVPTIQQPDDFKGQIIDNRHFFVYPNPVRGANVKFKFFLKQNAQITIKVFTPQGKFVWETSGDYPLGWNELSWNASGMANGVYFYIGEAKNGSILERITKKLGLVK